MFDKYIGKTVAKIEIGGYNDDKVYITFTDGIEMKIEAYNEVGEPTLDIE